MGQQNKHYSTMKLLSMYFKKQSKIYQEKGYHYAKTASFPDMGERFLAFLCDSSVMVLPIFIWIVATFLILAGVVPVTLKNTIDKVIMVLVVVNVLIVNPIISTRTRGQTIGRFVYDMKVVRFNKKETSLNILFLREFIGFSIPFLLLVYFFNLYGVLIYWLINGICVLVLPKHTSIIDLFTRTQVVVLHPIPVEIVSEKEQIVYSKYDLHIHSNYSHDGEMTVEDIFKVAKERNLKCISITDHNIVKANQAAIRMSELYGVDYIPGVELDCLYEGRRVHILGYFINYTMDIYAHLENENLMNEKKAGLERVAKFEKYSGLKVDTELLLENDRFQIITGEMIAQYILHKPEYQHEEMLLPYLTGSRSDNPYVNFYRDFFAYGSPCYVPIHFPSLKDVLDIISLTGGISVLAHPGKSFADDDAFVERLLNEGIEGIELFTPYHDNALMTKYLRLAKERKLLITGGSNFHGKKKPQLHIGASNMPEGANKLIEMFIDTK